MKNKQEFWFVDESGNIDSSNNGWNYVEDGVVYQQAPDGNGDYFVSGEFTAYENKADLLNILVWCHA